MPAGYLSSATEGAITDAARRDLPPQLADLVAATKRPYIQAIHDMSASRLVLGTSQRVLLLGDAAGLVRPHTAAGTSKAAGDAIELADMIEAAVAGSSEYSDGTESVTRVLKDEDMTQVLTTWEQSRLQHLRGLELRGRVIGDRHGYEAPEKY